MIPVNTSIYFLKDFVFTASFLCLLVGKYCILLNVLFQLKRELVCLLLGGELLNDVILNEEINLYL